ncbi:MAG: formate dehydrogenase accessory sulfurtransferase FdhD [Chloroflexi bacterium]|nr:formate dehydrogenase accessory sulfurtransferase FdhD [Chloroflexota bacterium]
MTLDPFEPPRRGLERLPWTYLRVRGGVSEEVAGSVVGEEPLEVVLNDQVVAILMRTPGYEKELAVGFALGEGLITSFADVMLVQHCGQTAFNPAAASDALDLSRNRVSISLRGALPANDPRRSVTRLVRAGCGRVDASELAIDLPALPRNGPTVPAAALGGLSQQMLAGQDAYRQSGGVHAAAVFAADGRLITLMEDVGRHNAVDKATGHCLLRGIPLHDKVLVSTGRASYDMVAKAVRLGIPVAASRSSPTSLAVELAEPLGCTLIGYLRGDRYQVYTHPWRIAF